MQTIVLKSSLVLASNSHVTNALWEKKISVGVVYQQKYWNKEKLSIANFANAKLSDTISIYFTPPSSTVTDKNSF